jgi:HemK-like putative methylase
VLLRRLRCYHRGDELADHEMRWLRDGARDSTLYERSLNPTQRLSRMISERCASKPIAYILGANAKRFPSCFVMRALKVLRSAKGTQPFGPLELRIRPPVLIPRPETEYWVTRLAAVLAALPSPRPLRILEIGAGSGCVSVLLAALLSPGSASIVAVDVLPQAVALAQENAKLVDLNRVAVVQLDVTSPSFPSEVGPPFDVVVSNPPYIPLVDWKALDRSVKDWESPLALVGGHDGLSFYRRIAELLPALLKPEGTVAVEVGQGQASQVAEILHATRKDLNTEIWNDQYGTKRTVVLR